jgi:hypothetical protein
MRHAGILVSLVVLLLVGGLLHYQQTTMAAPHGKKSCHFVTKKVHGKKRRVKVCQKSKPHKTSTPKPHKTSTPEASPTATMTDYNALATRLATAITAAPSADARYQALVSALDALHIPVVNADGSAAGAITTPGTFFLPAGEVHSLASGYDGHSVTSLSVPASILAAAHVQIGGASPTADSLHDALVSSLARATSAPTDSHSLADLLLLRLGLDASPARDPRSTPAGQPDLDPLQQVLVLVQGLLPVTHHAANEQSGFMYSRFSPDACTDPTQTISTRWWDQSMTTAPVSGGDSITFVNLTTVVGAATVWQYQIQVDSSMPGGTETHYGPASHDPPLAGKDLVFALHVDTQALDTAPCAPPFAVPSHGSGIGVSWHDEDLLPHGQVDSPVPITDNAGSNHLVFHPKDEAIPGVGAEVTKPVTVTADLSFQETVSDSILQAELKTLFAMSPLTFHATISYHQPRGFTFSGVHVHYWTELVGTRSDQYIVISGHACGPDPFATAWQLHAETTTVNSNGTYTDSNDFSWDFKTDTVYPGAGEFFQILPGPPAQMQVTWGAAAPVQPSRDTATVPPEEDTSCPQP